MVHLSRLLVSTKAQVCFLSETRNSTITKSSIKNHFNRKDAFVVPSNGKSGGLWLMWSDEIDITIFDHNHHYIFALCINQINHQQYGLVCIYGDPHHRTTNVIWQQVHIFVMQNSNLPMFCMGDLNEIMHANEKLGSTRIDVNRISTFCAYVKQCSFIDLGYNGPACTWTNKKFTSTPTYERLDRCLGNVEWCKVFPSTTIYHLPMLYSDHAPILEVLNSSQPRTNKPFRFENWWLMEQDFQDVAKQSWERSSTCIFSYKTKSLAAELRKWRRKKPKNTDLIAQI
jgi:endonuclease/exonuclease/phosphatase family metal-dependent hydrolase